MNYQRGLNRAFFVFCIVWVFFILVAVPVVVWIQVQGDILSNQRHAAEMSALSSQIPDDKSKKYHDEEVKLWAQEYDKWRNFSFFYKELLGKGGGTMLLAILLKESSGASAEKASLAGRIRPALGLVVVISIFPVWVLPMSILEGPPGWLVILFLMFLPPGLVYGLGWIMLATLRWIVRGFRDFPAHTS